ncbi:MAG: helix-turn-helix domain-containing protein [Parcubacteria group bacterium]
MEKEYLTTAEAAKKLGVSRVTVFNRIKSGEIKAKKFGRNFAIPKNEIIGSRKELSDKEKKLIDEAVKKTVKEYGVALKMLGQE